MKITLRLVAITCYIHSSLRVKCRIIIASASVFVALCHSQVSLTLSTDISITETTYSCQF